MMMNLSSLLADKFFAFLLADDDPAQRRQTKRTTPLRPPWDAADAFRTLCTGCGACAQACGSGIISMDEGGFPIVDFKQGSCTFCGDCARSCPTGALRFESDKAPWHLALRIAESCLLRSRMLCLSCSEQCGKAAIQLPKDEGQLPLVAADQCTGCGACVSVCPVGAISLAPVHEGE